MNKKIILPVLTAAALLLAAAIYFFREPAPIFTWLDFYIGKVEVLKQNGTTVPAKIKTPLDTQDTVRTGEKSRAFIQYGADIIFEVAENSSVLMEQLPADLRSSGDKTSLTLVSGKVSALVTKLQKAGSFKVRYGTTTVAVRGTVFSIEGTGSGLLIKVQEGIVSISDDNHLYGDFEIKQGQKADINGSLVNISAMDENDVNEFHDITAVRPIAGMKCTPEEYVDYYFRWLLDIKDKIPAENQGDQSDQNDKSDNPPADDKSSPVNDTRTRININQLAANGVEQNEAADVTMKLYNRLSALKGSDSIIYRKVSGKAMSANRQLSGRISRLGNKYIIMVSVMNGKTGNVIYNKTRSVAESDLDKTIDTFAAEIGGSGEIWETK